MSILGLNILGDRGLSEDRIFEDARTLGAKYHVVMNNPSLAQRLLALNTNVIFRHWPDDNAQDNSNPRERVRMLDRIAPKGCLFYLVNEPRREAIPALNTWTVAAIDECEKLGRKAVILNFATGNPEPGDWEALRPCIERAFAGRHILGLHQYFDRKVDTSFPWHVGREREVYAVFGDKTPQIVITELGCAVEFHPLKGWRNALTSEAYSSELAKAADHYRKRGIFACVFATCPPADTQWGTFAPSPKLIRAMSNYNEIAQQTVVTENEQGAAGSVATRTSGIPKPEKPGKAKQGRLQTSTFIRVRNAPSLSGDELAQLVADQLVTWYPATQRTADGLDWVWVETNTVSGWMGRVWETWENQFLAVATPVETHTQGQQEQAVDRAQLLEAAQKLRADLTVIEQTAEQLKDAAKDMTMQLEWLITQLSKLSQ